ncbi:eCIS core domain-containing protein [Rheinheimera sp. EpRS3]|uniref:eCIS core domain-containing protein n=1 Tax=Rheinheimera sp. EpRS3 TaxID=1712383 RepID=UPI0009E6BBB9|nr:DUF4157 domain-containing protein [Rheinheimera sp. EpRS3]
MKFAVGRTSQSQQPVAAAPGSAASAALQQSSRQQQQARQLQALKHSKAALIQHKPDESTVSQQAALEDEEPMQGKFETAQKMGLEDEELMQGKFDATVQRQPDEEEPLQGKFEPGAVNQRQADAAPANNTGMPDQLKSGIESLSGYVMDDVKVHYNSAKPAQMQAHAYAQGSDIHIAPGQEQHLPHEAWHVVQQKQGRVQATTQLKGEAINDDPGLEHEADVMGAKALNAAQVTTQLSSAVHSRLVPGCVAQREVVAGTLVVNEGGYPCFAYDGKKYHIDENEPKHVTCDTDGRTHYYFEGSGTDIVGNVGPGKNKKSKQQIKFKFEALPAGVQSFIKNNYNAIVNAVEKGVIAV